MRALFILITLWGILPVYSQNNLSELRNLVTAHETVRSHLWADKQYKLALDLMLVVNTKLEQLDEKTKSEASAFYKANLYNIACAYSLLNQPKNAIAYLNLAIDKGYNNYYWTKEASDLNNIRKAKGYLATLSRMRETGDYKYILKQYPSYNNDSVIKLPVTTFQAAEELSSFRLKYNLDSIAGHGDEFSKIVNLMQWVHRIVPHDGSSDNPAQKRADDLITICQKEGRGINCRMMAMILNDAYLAMGFRSRYVTCLPKGEKFDDCHVINMVYSHTFKKWLWMDPTFETYVMDESNTPLSIFEVRERLIHDLPLIVSPGINWNGQFYSGGGERYLHQYMAKNLFRFSIPVNSVSGNESAGNQPVFIDLYPVGYNDNSVAFGVNLHNHYYTNNSRQFWED